MQGVDVDVDVRDEGLKALGCTFLIELDSELDSVFFQWTQIAPVTLLSSPLYRLKETFNAALFQLSGRLGSDPLIL